MPKTLLDVLLTLLASPENNRVIRMTPPGDWGPRGEVEATPAAVEEETARVVGWLAPLWGPPAFHGYWGEEGFPDWAVAYDLVACWPRGGRFVYVGCNAGTRMPLVLEFWVSDRRPDAPS